MKSLVFLYSIVKSKRHIRLVAQWKLEHVYFRKIQLVQVPMSLCGVAELLLPTGHGNALPPGVVFSRSEGSERPMELQSG